MELLLILVVVLSLGLAAVMAVISWKLLRQGRDRSAARAAALEALAARAVDDEGEDEAPAQHQVYWSREAEPDPADDLDEIYVAERSPHSPDEEDSWDLTMRPACTHVGPPSPATSPDELERRRSRRPAAVSDHMFEATTAGPSRPGRQRLAAFATAILVIGTGAGIVYAVRSADAIAELTRRVTRPNPASLEPLGLLSLRHTSDPSGAFIVTGLVQNPLEGASLSDVVAVVYLFDDEGKYFASGRALLDLRAFRPGDESPFVVTIPNAGEVSRYRVGFRFDDGGVVSHVDRRGALPSGTTGDAVNGVDRGLDQRPATPHRVEG